MQDIRTGTCPLCSHGEIVEGTPAEFIGHTGTEVAAAFTYEPRWATAGRNPLQPFGRLRYYMCRGCGYLLCFVEEPGGGPFGAPHRTRLITSGGKATPYR
jgi:hypothetical protein